MNNKIRTWPRINDTTVVKYNTDSSFQVRFVAMNLSLKKYTLMPLLLFFKDYLILVSLGRIFGGKNENLYSKDIFISL